ncbi:DUF4297 domain-containing protein [Deinococcus sp. 12RED42]|nr:dsDNA nuclease domain-containing protein [Deinococcus sp. 12RED42]MCD0166388.1 DUF4297 domain-containing protein [Deinococcus sp. 12RED42]
MSTSPAPRPSYRVLQPLERGGVRARRGFYYQDHVAAQYCLQMLSDPDLLEVWCEGLDDVTLVWRLGSLELFEFVQVKKLDLKQFWSTALLIRPDGKIKRDEAEDEEGQAGGDQALSLLQKSLANDRGDEPCCFRLVTSVKPNKLLRLLMSPRGHAVRRGARFIQLRAELLAALPGFTSENGNDVGFWTDSTVWEVHDSYDTLQYKNLHTLRAFGDQTGHHLQEDQWVEVYKKILQLVQDAAMQHDDYALDSQRLSKSTFTSWLQQAIAATARPGQGGVKMLERKLTSAHLHDRLDHAIDQRIAYRRRAVDSGYFNLASREDVEAAARHVLGRLVASLDAGVLEPGPAFYEECLTALDNLAREFPGHSFVWPSFLEGYMYDLAQRCVHRFGRPLI